MTSLFKNASWGGLSAAARLAFGVGNIFLAIKLAGSVAYGYLALISSVTVFYVALIGSVHTVAVTHAAHYRQRAGQEKNIESLFSLVWLVTCCSALILVLLAAWFGNSFVHAFVYWGGDAEVESQLSSLLILVVMMALSQLFSAGNVAVIESLGRFDRAAQAQMMGPFVVFICLMLLFLLGEEQWSVLDVGKAMIVGGITDVILTSAARTKMGYLSAFKPSLQAIGLFGALFKGGVALQGARLINIFFDPLNKYLLNYFVGAESVSVYDFAIKIIFGIQGLFGGAFRSFLQMVGGLGGDSGQNYLKALSYGLVPAVVIHGVISIAFFSFFCLLGDAFSSLPYFFVLLIPGSLGVIVVAPLYSALIGAKDFGFVFKAHLILSVLNGVISVLFIPVIGLYGAGIGFLIATVYNVFSGIRRYQKVVGQIAGVATVVEELLPKLFITVSSLFILLASELFINSDILLWVVRGGLLLLFSGVLVFEPMTRRVFRLFL